MRIINVKNINKNTPAKILTEPPTKTVTQKYGSKNTNAKNLEKYLCREK
jgi:hypothetical protein